MNAEEEELQSLDRRPALGTREEEAEEGDLQTGAAAAEVTNAQTNRAAAVPPVVEGDLEAGRPAAEIKWQLAPNGFLRPTPHNWYIVCVTSLLTELVVSIAQSIIPAAEGR